VLRFQTLAKVMPKWTESLEATGRKLEDTAEFKVAKWLQDNTPDGTRVVAPGNYGFFLNYFVNVPQLRGALYQSSTHEWPDHIYYQLTNGKDAQISAAWLKIGNISNLVYTTGASAEVYKDYKVPAEKFDSILRRAEEKNGDIYYQVPLKNPVLAKLVDLAPLENLKKPFNAIDEEPIFSYLSWIEEKSDSKLELQKIANNKYKISGNVEQGEGILVQITHDAGWDTQCKAPAEGEARQGRQSAKCKVKIKKDPLGFILLEPKTAGEQEILLQHGFSLQVWFGWLVTAATIGILGAKFLKSRRETAQPQT